jgi:hypothetical protein
LQPGRASSNHDYLVMYNLFHRFMSRHSLEYLTLKKSVTPKPIPLQRLSAG